MMASFPVLAAPQDGGTEDIAFWPGNQSTGLHYSETGKSQSPPTRFQSDEISSSGDELTTKVRKPYTITKQRERWTEEEHQKFLEALKMHGRAWRRIEEHIGTKTAVQIRSHAQKFFSKLERDASARGIPLGKVQDISIPPPRPKRKPSHPYPRKAGTAIQSSSSTVEEGNRSPPTVCSVPDRPSVGLSVGGGTRKSAAFTPYSARTRPLAMNEDVNLQETKMESSSTNSSQLSLKLFGQTVLVPTIVSALGHDIQGAFKEFSSLKQEGSPFECQNPEDQKLENGKGASYTIGQKPQTKALANSRNAPIAASNALSSGSGISMLEGSGESNTNAYCTEKHTGQEDSGDQTDEQPSSELDNNLNSLSREHQAPAAVPGYPRHVPVQYVDGSMPEKVHDTLKYGINAVSLGHKFAAMSMLNGNSSLSKASEQLQADIQNSSQLNFILPISGIPGHFNLSSYNNLENFGCNGGFVAPGSCPNGSLPPWHVAQSTVLHHPAYAAASLAATFWPGLASGVTAGTTAEPLGPDDGQNGLTHEETSAAAAITAATVAAASAWWTLHGAVPPPFLHPSIYGPVVATLAAEAAAVAAVTAGNSFHAFKTQPVMAVKKQEQMIASKGEGILDAISVNSHADAEGAVNALQQLDDGKPSKLKTSLCPQANSINCLPQSSPSGSEHDTISCMEELYGAELQEGKKNSQTEEHDHKATCTNSSDGEKMINPNFLKERSSSGSNTPSSTDPEMDPYLGTDIEAIKGNNEKDFEFTGIGSGSSEAAIEDALVEEEETKGCIEPETQDEIEGEGNSPSTKQDEKMDNGGKHVHKDRYQGVAGDSVGRRSKCGGHVNDTWKAVSEEGRIAFQALFNRDVLPQSFSPPNNLRGQGLVPKSSSKESFSNDAKQNPRKAPVDEMQADVQDRLANQIKAYNGDVDPQGVCGEEIPLKDAASSTWGKKIQISGATIRDQSLEDFRTSLPPTVSTALDFDKPPKSLAISSFGNFRSGLGFVPYQRCSIDSKKNRLHMRPIQNRADNIRERKRICLKQELEE